MSDLDDLQKELKERGGDCLIRDWMGVGAEQNEVQCRTLEVIFWFDAQGNCDAGKRAEE